MDIEAWDDYEDGGGAAPQGAKPQEGEEIPDLQKPKPRARRAPARKRPKLTMEDLEKPGGLKDVFENFPKWFAEDYRGKGHEVRDLRRLLELYQRWQPRVFNHCSYNQFEQTLEKLSGTHVLKQYLQKMRQELYDKVDPRREQPEQDDEQHEQQQQQDGQEAAQQQGSSPGGTGFGGFADVDDDELLAMQAEAAMVAAEEAVPDAFDQHVPAPAAAAVPSAAAQTVNTGVDSNMNTNTAKRSMRDWSDDDSDDDLGFSRQPQRQQQQQQRATASQPAGSGGGRAPGAAGRAAAASGSSSDDGDCDLQVQPRKAAGAAGGRSRLQRQAAAASEEEGVMNEDQQQADDANTQQQRQQQQHQRVKPGGRCQMLLDDDDSDDNDAAAPVLPNLQEPASQAAGIHAMQQQEGGLQLAGTEGDADVGDQPLELLLGTELDAILAQQD